MYHVTPTNVSINGMAVSGVSPSGAPAIETYNQVEPIIKVRTAMIPCSLNFLAVSWVVVICVPAASDSDPMGLPQLEQAGAEFETSHWQSGHFISAIRKPRSTDCA